MQSKKTNKQGNKNNLMNFHVINIYKNIKKCIIINKLMQEIMDQK